MPRPQPIRGVWPVALPEGRQGYELRRADGSLLFPEPFVLPPDVLDPYPYAAALWDILNRLDPVPAAAGSVVIALV